MSSLDYLNAQYTINVDRNTGEMENRIREFHTFVKEFPNGIGLKTFKAAFPQYGVNCMILPKIMEYSEGTLIKMMKKEKIDIIYPLRCKKIEQMSLIKGLELTKGGVFQVHPICVESCNSFYVSFSDDFKRLDRISNSLFNYYKISGEDQCFNAQQKISTRNFDYCCIRDIMYEDRYWRVKVNAFNSDNSFVNCTLIDFGGRVNVATTSLLQLPPMFHPSKKTNEPVAILCLLDSNQKFNGFPHSRRALQVILTNFDSSNIYPLKNFKSSGSTIQIKFLSFVPELGGYLVSLPINECIVNSDLNLIKKKVHQTPELFAMDKYYTDNFDFGKF